MALYGTIRWFKKIQFKLLRYPDKWESRRRSALKSIVWRVLGVITLATVTYAFTRELVTTSLITISHHLVFIFLYYAHERFWLKISFLRNSRLRPFLRVITYELILANIILGLISLIFTGELQKATAITLTYTTNKYWMYYAYDFIWSKAKWQTEAR